MYLSPKSVHVFEEAYNNRQDRANKRSQQRNIFPLQSQKLKTCIQEIEFPDGTIVYPQAKINKLQTASSWESNADSIDSIETVDSDEDSWTAAVAKNMVPFHCERPLFIDSKKEMSTCHCSTLYGESSEESFCDIDMSDTDQNSWAVVFDKKVVLTCHEKPIWWDSSSESSQCIEMYDSDNDTWADDWQIPSDLYPSAMFMDKMQE